MLKFTDLSFEIAGCVCAEFKVRNPPQSLSTYFIGRGNMELSKDEAGWPENFRDPPVSASPVSRCQAQVAKPGSYVGVRDLSTGPPQIVHQSTLPNGPSPQVQDKGSLKTVFDY